MKHELRHELSPELAKKTAERAFESYREKFARYSPTLVWAADDKAEVSFSVKGITLRGQIELLPRAITFDLDVPFVFKVFKGKAISIMERELTHWAAKAKAGDI
jgi:hypothetical protein